MKVAYTVSDIWKIVDQTVLSIKSVRKFFQRGEVVVFYTPPRSKKNQERLSALAEVREVENLTDPFDPWRKGRMSRYGEKVHLCSLDDEVVFFLDADTRVKGDLRDLLEGDFDVALRRDDWVNDRALNWDKWRAMFKRAGKEPIDVPNAGFMVFKNGTHRDIGDEWLRLLNSNLENPGTSYLKDMYSLALAVSGRRIKWLSPMECSHTFADEPEAAYVVHLGHTTTENQSSDDHKVSELDSWINRKGEEHYRPLFNTLKTKECRNIMEIGTFNGDNAVMMIKAAATKVPEEEIHYYGFDLFEETNPQIAKEEFSGSFGKLTSEAQARANIEGRTKAKVTLVKGNTRETLPKAVESMPKMDLIYIDGGHTIETTRNDWKHASELMERGTIVYFDDYCSEIPFIGPSFLLDELPTKYVAEVMPEVNYYPMPFGRLKSQLLKVQHRREDS